MTEWGCYLQLRGCSGPPPSYARLGLSAGSTPNLPRRSYREQGLPYFSSSTLKTVIDLYKIVTFKKTLNCSEQKMCTLLLQPLSCTAGRRLLFWSLKEGSQGVGRAAGRESENLKVNPALPVPAGGPPASQ